MLAVSARSLARSAGSLAPHAPRVAIAAARAIHSNPFPRFTSPTSKNGGSEPSWKVVDYLRKVGVKMEAKKATMAAQGRLPPGGLPGGLPVASTLWFSTKRFLLEMKMGIFTMRDNITEGNRLKNIKRPLTRREFILLRQNSEDTKALIPFGLLSVLPFSALLIPIAVSKFPSVLPSTFESVYNKRQRILKRNLSLNIHSDEQLVVARQNWEKLCQVSPTSLAGREASSLLDSKDTRAAVLKWMKDTTYDLGAASRVDGATTDPALSQLVKATNATGGLFGFALTKGERLLKKCEHIDADDKLIHNDGVQNMSSQECVEACLERGIPMALDEKEMHKDSKEKLKLWIHRSVAATKAPGHSQILGLVNAFSAFGDMEGAKAVEATMKANKTKKNTT